MQASTATRYLRLNQIIGQRPVTRAEADANRAALAHHQARGEKAPRRPLRARPGIAPILPVSATVFWELVKQGVIPAPTKVGGSSLWHAADIEALTPDRLRLARAQRSEKRGRP